MMVGFGKRFVKAIIWRLGKTLKIPHRKKKSAPERIMIVRTDRIGDFVLFMPALRSIREKYHNSFLILVAQDVVSGLAAATPLCNKVMGFNEIKYRRNPFYKLAFLFRSFKLHADLCLCPAYSRDYITDEIALWSGAAEKIAWDTNLPNMSLREKNRGNRIYSRLLKSSLGSWDHEWERNREWLKLMHIPAADSPFFFTVQKKSIIDRIGIKEFYNWNLRITVLPGAGAECRKWGKSNFIMLMRRLLQIRSDIGFVIIGTEDDRFEVADLDIDNLKSNCLDLCGRILLQDLIRVFSESHLVIGNESGPMHLAIASGVHTLSILGGGHFGRFMPYGDALKNRFIYKKMDCFQCNWHCIYPQIRCISEISIEDVLNPAKTLLCSSDFASESQRNGNHHPGGEAV